MSILSKGLSIQEKALAKLQTQVNALTPEEQKAALDNYNANIDRWEEEHAANAAPRSNLEQKVLDFVKKDPKKAARALDKPAETTIEQIYKVTHGEANISPILDDSTNETISKVTGVIGTPDSRKIIEEASKALEQGAKESTQPIWGRDSSKKIFGESGADDLQNIFNPARWVENGIDKTPIIPDNAKDTVKTYLPIVALGAGALFLLAALK